MSLTDEEPNIFLRKEREESDDDSGKWDDTKLIRAYDKCISRVKRSLMRKVQKELGMADEDVEEFLSTASSSDSESEKTKKSFKKKDVKQKWTVGNSCRAVYSVDGEEYEAVIIDVIDSARFVVRYVGYENEEEVRLKDLSPSLGKAVVQLQIEAANKDSLEDKEHEAEPPKQDRDLKNNSEYRRWFRPILRPPMGCDAAISPFPPPPPSLMNPMMDSALNSMLISWYMCGYYTGFHQSELHNNKDQTMKRTLYE